VFEHHGHPRLASKSLEHGEQGVQRKTRKRILLVKDKAVPTFAGARRAIWKCYAKTARMRPLGHKPRGMARSECCWARA
jgi:hypothetical protein